MELSLLLIQQIGAMFIMIALGFTAIKTKLIKPEDGKMISKIAVYIVSPCMTLSAFQIEFSADKLTGLLIATLAAIIVHAVYITLIMLLKKPLKLRKIEQASMIYSNAGNMIIPLVTNVLGAEWVFYTSAFITVQTFLMWTHAKSLVQGEKDWGFKQIIFNPNIIAIIVALVLFVLKIQLPSVVKSAAQSMGQMIGPLCMFVVGILLSEMTLKKLISYKRAFLVCAGRLIVLPCIMLFVFKFCGLTGLHADAEKILLIVLLASCSPSASTVTQFAQIYDCEAGYSSVINICTTLLSILTMPVIVMLYQLIVMG